MSMSTLRSIVDTAKSKFSGAVETAKSSAASLTPPGHYSNRCQTYQITGTKPIRYWTHQKPYLSKIKFIRYQAYEIPTEFVRYQTYQIINLPDTKLVRYQTYQITGTNLSDTELIRNHTYHKSNLSDTKHMRYLLNLSDTKLIRKSCWLLQ